MSLLLEGQVKISLDFDYDKGDRITISNRWLKDKSKLSPEERKELRRLLRMWQAKKGKDFPIFEPKRHVIYNQECMRMFGVELQKREPPIHIIVLVTDTNPNFGNPKKPNPKGKLYIFDRVLKNYDEYKKYMNLTLKTC